MSSTTGAAATAEGANATASPAAGGAGAGAGSSASASAVNTAIVAAGRKRAGFAGLANQGATCYMNSLLQTLFMTPEFRRVLFAWRYDKEKDDEPGDSIPYQLQLLFAQLQLTEARAITTTALTHSFGWTGRESFQQHDVQELARVLFDALERSLSGTANSTLIQDLFKGTAQDFVRCTVCKRERRKEAVFLDLSLTLQQFGSDKVVGSVEEALDNEFLRLEVMDGDNKVECEACAGKTKSVKGFRIAQPPYLLQLSLKRFVFDFVSMNRAKLNARVTFPLVLDLNKYVAAGLDTAAAVEEAADQAVADAEAAAAAEADRKATAAATASAARAGALVSASAGAGAGAARGGASEELGDGIRVAAVDGVADPSAAAGRKRKPGDDDADEGKPIAINLGDDNGWDFDPWTGVPTDSGVSVVPPAAPREGGSGAGAGAGAGAGGADDDFDAFAMADGETGGASAGAGAGAAGSTPHARNASTSPFDFNHYDPADYDDVGGKDAPDPAESGVPLLLADGPASDGGFGYSTSGIDRSAYQPIGGSGGYTAGDEEEGGLASSAGAGAGAGAGGSADVSVAAALAPLLGGGAGTGETVDSSGAADPDGATWTMASGAASAAFSATIKTGGSAVASSTSSDSSAAAGGAGAGAGAGAADATTAGAAAAAGAAKPAEPSVRERALALAKEKGPYVYELYGVLVHSGGAAGGHYYAYIKDLQPDPVTGADCGRWWNFNDSSVSPISEADVLAAAGGAQKYSSYGGYSSYSYESSANAYLLMYRQVLAAPEVTLECTLPGDVPVRQKDDEPEAAAAPAAAAASSADGSPDAAAAAAAPVAAPRRKPVIEVEELPPVPAAVAALPAGSSPSAASAEGSQAAAAAAAATAAAPASAEPAAGAAAAPAPSADAGATGSAATGGAASGAASSSAAGDAVAQPQAAVPAEGQVAKPTKRVRIRMPRSFPEDADVPPYIKAAFAEADAAERQAEAEREARLDAIATTVYYKTDKKDIKLRKNMSIADITRMAWKAFGLDAGSESTSAGGAAATSGSSSAAAGAAGDSAASAAAGSSGKGKGLTVVVPKDDASEASSTPTSSSAAAAGAGAAAGATGHTPVPLDCIRLRKYATYHSFPKEPLTYNPRPVKKPGAATPAAGAGAGTASAAGARAGAADSDDEPFIDPHGVASSAASSGGGAGPSAASSAAGAADAGAQMEDGSQRTLGEVMGATSYYLGDLVIETRPNPSVPWPDYDPDAMGLQLFVYDKRSGFFPATPTVTTAISKQCTLAHIGDAVERATGIRRTRQRLLKLNNYGTTPEFKLYLSHIALGLPPLYAPAGVTSFKGLIDEKTLPQDHMTRGAVGDTLTLTELGLYGEVVKIHVEEDETLEAALAPPAPFDPFADGAATAAPAGGAAGQPEAQTQAQAQASSGSGNGNGTGDGAVKASDFDVFGPSSTVPASLDEFGASTGNSNSSSSSTATGTQAGGDFPTEANQQGVNAYANADADADAVVEKPRSYMVVRPPSPPRKAYVKPGADLLAGTVTSSSSSSSNSGSSSTATTAATTTAPSSAPTTTTTTSSSTGSSSSTTAASAGTPSAGSSSSSTFKSPTATAATASTSSAAATAGAGVTTPAYLAYLAKAGKAYGEKGFREIHGDESVAVASLESASNAMRWRFNMLGSPIYDKYVTLDLRDSNEAVYTRMAELLGAPVGTFVLRHKSATGNVVRLDPTAYGVKILKSRCLGVLEDQTTLHVSPGTPLRVGEFGMNLHFFMQPSNALLGTDWGAPDTAPLPPAPPPPPPPPPPPARSPAAILAADAASVSPAVAVGAAAEAAAASSSSSAAAATEGAGATPSSTASVPPASPAAAAAAGAVAGAVAGVAGLPAGIPAKPERRLYGADGLLNGWFYPPLCAAAVSRQLAVLEEERLEKEKEKEKEAAAAKAKQKQAEADAAPTAAAAPAATPSAASPADAAAPAAAAAAPPAAPAAAAPATPSGATGSSPAAAASSTPAAAAGDKAEAPAAAAAAAAAGDKPAVSAAEREVSLLQHLDPEYVGPHPSDEDVARQRAAEEELAAQLGPLGLLAPGSLTPVGSTAVTLDSMQVDLRKAALPGVLALGVAGPLEELTAKLTAEGEAATAAKAAAADAASSGDAASAQPPAASSDGNAAAPASAAPTAAAQAEASAPAPPAAPAVADPAPWKLTANGKSIVHGSMNWAHAGVQALLARLRVRERKYRGAQPTTTYADDRPLRYYTSHLIDDGEYAFEWMPPARPAPLPGCPRRGPPIPGPYAVSVARFPRTIYIAWWDRARGRITRRRELYYWPDEPVFSIVSRVVAVPGLAEMAAEAATAAKAAAAACLKATSVLPPPPLPGAAGPAASPAAAAAAPGTPTASSTASASAAAVTSPAAAAAAGASWPASASASASATSAAAGKPPAADPVVRLLSKLHVVRVDQAKPLPAMRDMPSLDWKPISKERWSVEPAYYDALRPYDDGFTLILADFDVPLLPLTSEQRELLGMAPIVRKDESPSAGGAGAGAAGSVKYPSGSSAYSAYGSYSSSYKGASSYASAAGGSSSSSAYSYRSKETGVKIMTKSERDAAKKKEAAAAATASSASSTAAAGAGSSSSASSAGGAGAAASAGADSRFVPSDTYPYSPIGAAGAGAHKYGGKGKDKDSDDEATDGDDDGDAELISRATARAMSSAYAAFDADSGGSGVSDGGHLPGHAARKRGSVTSVDNPMLLKRRPGGGATGYDAYDDAAEGQTRSYGSVGGSSASSASAAGSSPYKILPPPNSRSRLMMDPIYKGHGGLSSYLGSSANSGAGATSGAGAGLGTKRTAYGASAAARGIADAARSAAADDGDDDDDMDALEKRFSSGVGVSGGTGDTGGAGGAASTSPAAAAAGASGSASATGSSASAGTSAGSTAASAAADKAAGAEREKIASLKRLLAAAQEELDFFVAAGLPEDDPDYEAAADKVSLYRTQLGKDAPAAPAASAGGGSGGTGDADAGTGASSSVSAAAAGLDAGSSRPKED